MQYPLNSPSKERLQKFKTYLVEYVNQNVHIFSQNLNMPKKDIKQTWKIINNVIGNGQKQSSLLKDQCGNVFTNPQDISNKFNDFFL